MQRPISAGLAVASAFGLPEEEAGAVVVDAWARRDGLAQAAAGSPAVARFAEIAVTGHVLAHLAATDRLRPRHVERVTHLLELGELASLVLFAETIRDPELLALPPEHVLEADLRILMSFAPISTSSLWVIEADTRLRCALCIGRGAPTKRERTAARAVLDGSAGHAPSERGSIHAVAVHRGREPVGAIVMRARPEAREHALVLAEEASSILAFAIERQALLVRSAEGERNLVESSERRLVRLGLDLHDGPIQELAALAADVRLLRRQVARALGDHEHADLLVGRVDDLQARLVELDRELRELTRSVESSTMLARPFKEVLAEELEGFSARHAIESEFSVQGRFDSLTASQRIALLRVVREALANVREHSGAARVSVTIVSQRTHVYLEVTDDGCGFEVERTLVQAARRGHLGLVGMSERIRLLGGRFDIHSRAGGPTTISAMVPKGRPATTSNDLARLSATGALVAAGS